MYEIGQQVVCVESHPNGVIKKDFIYTVTELRLCSCKNLTIGVGVIDPNPFMQCSKCGNAYVGNEWLFKANRFRPLDDLYNTEIEELMNEVNEKQPFEV